jgi:uncharacterized cupredoxin-like copper-binding protein
VRTEPGEEAETLWIFNSTSSFEFACLLSGHYEGGTRRPLTVNCPLINGNKSRNDF